MEGEQRRTRLGASGPKSSYRFEDGTDKRETAVTGNCGISRVGMEQHRIRRFQRWDLDKSWRYLWGLGGEILLRNSRRFIELMLMMT